MPVSRDLKQIVYFSKKQLVWPNYINDAFVLCRSDFSMATDRVGFKTSALNLLIERCNGLEDIHISGTNGVDIAMLQLCVLKSKGELFCQMSRSCLLLANY